MSKKKQATDAPKRISILNRKARHEYHLSNHTVAGLVLTGTEIKSIRQGKASLGEAYCYFHSGELFVKNMHISEYEKGNIYNHEPTRTRKLLLQKRELRKLFASVQEKGFTLIPTKLFISGRGWAKLEIALAKGKKLYDKRDDLKQKEAKREMDRQLKF